MVVYEATTKKDYQKIIEFMKNQPSDSLPSQCWRAGVQDFTIEQLKALRQGFQVFVCEDEKGNIRVFGMFERRGEDFNPREPSISVNAFVIMDNKDFEVKDITYAKEFGVWLANYYNAHDIPVGIYFVLEPYFELFQKVYGDSFAVLKTKDIALGKAYVIKLEFKKVS